MSKNFIEVGDLSKFTEIQSELDLAECIKRIQFVDGLIKELHLLNSAYVDEESTMYLNFNYNLRMLLQFTNRPYTAELIFGEILELHLTKADEVDLYEIDMKYEPLTEFKKIIVRIGQNKIVSRRLLYREVPAWTGIDSRFGEEIILDPLASVSKLEDGWVLCSQCGEVWDAKNRLFLKCPRCRGEKYT